MKRNRKGFTLVELMVVIALLGICLVVFGGIGYLVYSVGNHDQMEVYPEAKIKCIEECTDAYTNDVNWTEDERGKYWKCTCLDKYSNPVGTEYEESWND